MATAPSKDQDLSSEESLVSDDDDEDDDLALDGELVRRPESDADEEDKPPIAKRAKVVVSKIKTKDGDDDDDDDDDEEDEDVPIDRIDVDFVFCDLDDRFFHGMANFLSLQYNGTQVSVRPSLLADYLILSNNSVGTCISTAADQGDVGDASSQGNLYGYASIALLSPSSTRNSAASGDKSSSPKSDDKNNKKQMTADASREDKKVKKARLKQEEDDAAETTLVALLDYVKSKVPSSQDTKVTKQYFETPSSTTVTSQHVGLLSHARMVNLPLELVPVLHQQLLLDLDYATGLQPQRHDNHDNDEDENEDDDYDFRSLSHLVRIAPCDRDKRAGVLYKFFDDEHLAEAADAVYDISSGNNNNNGGGGVDSSSSTLLRAILIPLAAYRQVVADLARMFPSSA